MGSVAVARTLVEASGALLAQGFAALAIAAQLTVLSLHDSETWGDATISVDATKLPPE